MTPGDSLLLADAAPDAARFLRVCDSLGLRSSEGDLVEMLLSGACPKVVSRVFPELGLTSSEVQRVLVVLAAGLSLAGLSVRQIAERLGRKTHQVRAALAVYLSGTLPTKNATLTPTLNDLDNAPTTDQRCGQCGCRTSLPCRTCLAAS